jgi:hypothetical protein
MPFIRQDDLKVVTENLLNSSSDLDGLISIFCESELLYPIDKGYLISCALKAERPKILDQAKFKGRTPINYRRLERQVKFKRYVPALFFSRLAAQVVLLVNSDTQSTVNFVESCKDGLIARLDREEGCDFNCVFLH